MKNEALENFRKQKNLTAEEVAKLFGCDRATVYRWEKQIDRLPVSKLDHVAKVTGISKKRLRPDIFEVAR